MATATAERPRPASKPAAQPTIKLASKRAGVPLKLITTPARRSDLVGSDEGIDLSIFGGRLADARLRSQMTQADLAKAIGRVRATIVGYEGGDIKPPVEMIEELARVLRVSPSYLAFGEFGVKTGVGVAGDMLSVDEITVGRDGQYVSGAFAMPRNLAEGFVADPKNLRVFVLNHHAEGFNLRAGARIFTDISVTRLTNEFDQYLIEVSGGMEIVRITPSFGKSNMVSIEGPRGERSETRASNLKIIGAVVSTLNQN